MSSILGRIEEILARIVDQPISNIIADLKRLANEEADNPGPYLAMAIVSSFARNDFRAAEEYLSTAKRLLAADNSNDPELTFSRSLFSLISAEFSLLKNTSPTRSNILLPVLRARVADEKRSKAAFANLERAVKNLDSSLAKTLLAMFRAFSQTNPTKGEDYRRGLQELAQLSREGRSADLSSFFLIYAHRRARHYDQAIRAAQDLEVRKPNSPLVKRVIGSCYTYQKNLPDAQRYYRQALSLAPNDPSIQLGMARVLEQMDELDDAQRVINQMTSSLDREVELTPFVRDLNQDLQVREQLQRLRRESDSRGLDNF